MAESTEEKSVTLRSELKKLLTEDFYNGGGSGESEDGVLKTIDDAIRVLTCIRKEESKVPESDDNPPSSPVEVPKEFICPFSNTIMTKPVLIASGKTFEDRYISQYLKYQSICPITKQVLSHGLAIPNDLVDELITQWCKLNNYDRPKPSEVEVYQMSPTEIESLLKRISSPSSVQDQTEAARELRNQTNKFDSLRYHFVTNFDDSITRLLSPFSAPDFTVESNPELLENIFATLYNISIVERNIEIIASNPLVLPLLVVSMRRDGTTVTRRYCAATLRSFSLIDDIKHKIVLSDALKALISVIRGNKDNLVTVEACNAIMNICLVGPWMKEVISAGFIQALTFAIRDEINVSELFNVAELLAYLRTLSTNKLAVEEMGDLDFTDYVFTNILRKPSSSGIRESALGIVYNMCNLTTSDNDRILKLVNEEENEHGTFTKIARGGSSSDHAVEIAQDILDWYRKNGTGKEPMGITKIRSAD